VLAALWDSEKIREVAFLLRILLRSMLKNGQSQAQLVDSFSRPWSGQGPRQCINKDVIFSGHILENTQMHSIGARRLHQRKQLVDRFLCRLPDIVRIAGSRDPDLIDNRLYLIAEAAQKGERVRFVVCNSCYKSRNKNLAGNHAPVQFVHDDPLSRRGTLVMLCLWRIISIELLYQLQIDERLFYCNN
jgi:hypothetical protein